MQKKKSTPQANAKRHTGFTLTEIAVVLSIIGLILGVVWVAAASVNSNQRVDTTIGQFMTAIQSIRGLYSTSSSISTTDGTSITFNMCSANIFPSNMIASGGCSATIPVVDTWNGAVTVASASISTANTGDAFSIQMAGLDQNGCVGVLMGLGGATRDSGLLYLSGGTTAPTYTVGTVTTFPISSTTATSLCGNKSSSNYVMGVFKLKG